MNELGRFLVAAREAAGLGADVVARTTRIPVGTVQALEEGREADLPSPVFVRGFVVSYCRTVGADEARALELLAELSRARRAADAGEARDAPDPVGRLLVGARRPIPTTWTYLAIVLVFVVGILVALLAIGTGGGQGDLSRAGQPARVNLQWPSGTDR
jgi:cytoskeleton protein RodZ